MAIDEYLFIYFFTQTLQKTNYMRFFNVQTALKQGGGYIFFPLELTYTVLSISVECVIFGEKVYTELGIKLIINSHNTMREIFS